MSHLSLAGGGWADVWQAIEASGLLIWGVPLRGGNSAACGGNIWPPFHRLMGLGLVELVLRCCSGCFAWSDKLSDLLIQKASCLRPDQAG